MRVLLAVAAVLATAATVPARAVAMSPSGSCAQHRSEFPKLVGLEEAEAIAAMEKLPGIRTVRVAGVGSPVSEDYRADRATLRLQGGRVQAIVCG